MPILAILLDFGNCNRLIGALKRAIFTSSLGYLIGREDLGISNLADLKGKRIGLSEDNSRILFGPVP